MSSEYLQGLDTEPLEHAVATLQTASPVQTSVEFLTPTQINDYEPPEGHVLVGDNHVVRGAVFVIGGAPGVGKSRAAVALAVAGATCTPWFGLKVHRRFRTMILQNENGRLRLKQEFAALPHSELDDFVRVSPPPPMGFAFNALEFRSKLQQAYDEFKPDVLLLDPWNAAARDEKAAEYIATFNAIHSIIPAGDQGPALGIVAHTRKPKADERTTGRGLLNLLAGSYVLGSVPRAVFVLQPASEDPADDQVVWTCCKNNDGPMGEPSAWIRGNGRFEPVMTFDWKGFYGANKARSVIEAEDLEKLFDFGRRKIEKATAVKELMEQTGCCRAACYKALGQESRFSARLQEAEGLLVWS